MKNRMACLVLLMISLYGFSQEPLITKKYDFDEALRQSRGNQHTFTLISFDLSANQPLIAFTSQVIFPLLEEKKVMLFEVTNDHYSGPTVSFDNLYQSRPQFINFAPHLQQSQPGKMKILKGYDFCLRPIY